MRTEILLIIAAVLAALGLVALIIILVRKYEQQRTDALKALAASMQLSFSKQPDPGLLSSLGRFPLFSQGHSRKAKNVMTGKADEIGITLFDYRYTTGAGKSQHTHVQTVVVLSSGQLALPAFSLKPQNIFHNIGKAFGYQDIDFTTHPLFSERYLLRGADENAVRLCFTDPVLEYFEQRQKLSLEAGGDTLVFFRADKKSKPEDLPQLLKDAFHVYTLFKEEEKRK